jgi:hypothetical protein
MKPPCPYLYLGEGGRHLPLSGPMERYICPCKLSLTYGDPGSTQILTRPSVKLLASSRTREPCQLGKYPVSLAPLGYRNT